MKANIEKISRDVTAAAKQLYKEDLVKVTLYGSYARGDADEESDINYMLLVRLSEEDIYKMRNQVIHMASDLSLDHEILVSIDVENEDDFEENAQIFPSYQKIKREAKVCYSRT